jgi:hypothetical protein
MDNPEIPFDPARERDIDLLIMEELVCSPEFLRAFLAAAGFTVPNEGVDSSALKVRHSVVDAGGETDLLVELPLGGSEKGLRVYIENKVRAQFQPQQLERYQKRASDAVAAGECGQALVVLVAPEEYLEGLAHEGDVKTVSYQQMIGFLRSADEKIDNKELHRRLCHRISLFEHAIEDCRRGWQQNQDTHTTEFAKAYYERAKVIAPSLQPAAPNQRTKNTAWFYFNQALRPVPGLKPSWSILHKGKTKHHGGGQSSQEYVQILAKGWSKFRSEAEDHLRGLLEQDMELRRANKSLAIAIPTPTVEIEQPFETQIAVVDAGLEGALRLQRWYDENLDELISIAKRLGAQ